MASDLQVLARQQSDNELQYKAVVSDYTVYNPHIIYFNSVWNERFSVPELSLRPAQDTFILISVYLFLDLQEEHSGGHRL